jgi:hypothetical protein
MEHDTQQFRSIPHQPGAGRSIASHQLRVGRMQQRWVSTMTISYLTL